MPVKVTVDLPARPAAAIEGIAYFTVSELLQNISKHSGARTASVDVWRSDDRLLIQVWDDGRGGARLDGGTGMAGLAERLDAVDGLFVIDSPVGGPTASPRSCRGGTGATAGVDTGRGRGPAGMPRGRRPCRSMVAGGSGGPQRVVGRAKGGGSPPVSDADQP